jgi:hypothetical protein
MPNNVAALPQQVDFGHERLSAHCAVDYQYVAGAT